MRKKSYKKLLRIKERSQYQDYGWSDLEDDLEELEDLLLEDLSTRTYDKIKA